MSIILCNGHELYVSIIVDSATALAVSLCNAVLPDHCGVLRCQDATEHLGVCAVRENAGKNWPDFKTPTDRARISVTMLHLNRVARYFRFRNFAHMSSNTRDVRALFAYFADVSRFLPENKITKPAINNGSKTETILDS